ncbi:MAG: CRISPR-associated endonuclease Cas6 [Bacteroidia bacterium]
MMLYTRITFPELRLLTRDAHKLRGYFGNLFREHSPLLHNHLDDGRLRYAYPLVQYKVIDRVPCLVGIGEGGQLLTDLFLRIGEIKIEGQSYPVLSKNIENHDISPGVGAVLRKYTFATRWMALNQENYRSYRNLAPAEQQSMLSRVLTNHIVVMLRVFEADLSRPLMVMPEVTHSQTRFKDQQMTAFGGSFVANADLPEAIGIGKAVSRGFGTIIRQKETI